MNSERGAQELVEGVFTYLQPPGSWGLANAGLIAGGERSLLIDTFGDLAHTRTMLDAMHDAAPSAGAIDTLVNTHSDMDHCWGNQLLAPSAEIVASRAAAEAMGELDPAVVRAVVAAEAPGALGELIEVMFGHFDFSEVVLTPPTRTFEGALTLDVDGTRVELMEVGPAHTKGDVLVHLPERRVVFTGDIVFAGAHPVMWQGPLDNWLAACDAVLGFDPLVVVPGHGPVGDAGAVRDMRDYLSYVQSEARIRHDGGMAALEAAYDIDLGAYGGWIEQERIVVTVNSIYRELDRSAEPPNQVELIGQMADYRATRSRGSTG
jgi:cyclase